MKNNHKNNSLPWALGFFLKKHMFCLPYHKIQWTMSINDISLENMYFMNLELHGHFDHFSLEKP